VSWRFNIEPPVGRAYSTCIAKETPMTGNGTRFVVVAVGCLALAAALIVGISDNPPGLALMYGAVVCLLVAVVWRWRRPKSFFLLCALSAVGFIVFAVLHNLFYALGEATTAAWIHLPMEVLHVASFLVAVVLCPCGVLVGLVGWLVALVRSWEGSNSEFG
jgi:hypothetical protein